MHVFGQNNEEKASLTRERASLPPSCLNKGSHFARLCVAIRGVQSLTILASCPKSEIGLISTHNFVVDMECTHVNDLPGMSEIKSFLAGFLKTCVGGICRRMDPD